MVPCALTPAGTLPIENGKPYLGKIGIRRCYWTGAPSLRMTAEVSNGRLSGFVIVTE
jgi:hypothetical protein